MTYITNKDYLLEVSRGNVSGASILHKFGQNTAVGTSLAPVCNGGNYRTPTGTATLEIISSNANDSSAGTGAQELTLSYLDSSFVEQTATIETNGTSASATTVSGVKRLYRVFVSRSGSYASQTTPSQLGTITIRESGGGATWATLPQVSTGFGSGQSLIGAYTVPSGKTAYILTQTFSIDSNKTVDLYFFKRENANDVSAPYSGTMRLQNIYIGATGVFEIDHKTQESYPEFTDMGFLAKTGTGTANVAVEFELLLIDN